MASNLQSLVLLALALFSTASSQYQSCLTGLSVFNKTNHLVLPLGDCNHVVEAKSLADSPMITFTRARNNETYLLMLLESTRLPDIYILHWLVSEVKAIGESLQTSFQSGARDLTGGYSAPINQTQYEFRLYNTTGNVVYEAVTNAERINFFPSQWLAKNRVHSAPIAKSLFAVKSFIPGPPGGWVVTNPATQPLPPYTVPGHPYPQGNYPVPPVVSGHPITYPSNLPPPPLPSGQVPHYPVSQPQLPSNQQPFAPPQFPTNQLPPQIPPNQHQMPHVPPQYLPHYPTQPTKVKNSYNINGTWYYVQTPDRPPRNNQLIINSTIYSTDTYNKHFRLTPFLMIDYETYIWRNLTRMRGNGQSFYINNTMYIPYTQSTNEIHHHHHYKKGGASSLNPSSLFFVLLIPSLISILRA